MQKFIFKEKYNFLNNLFRSDACQQLWVRNKSGMFKEIFFCKASEFTDKLDKFIVNSSCDYYILKNLCYADKRGNDYLYSLENIVVDLDNHYLSEKKVKFEVQRLLWVLLNDYNGKFPSYTAKVFTGRGVQLWFHFESIAGSLVWLYDLVVRQLCDRLTEIINENNIDLSVDYTASCSPCGLVRLPYSFNSVAKNYIDDVEYWFYSDYATIDDIIDVYDLKRRSERVHITFKSEEDKPKPEDSQYKALHLKRIKFLEGYVERKNYSVVGQRNTLCFLYYNALVQVHEHDVAVHQLECFNNSFSSPYSSTELETVIRAVNKKTYKFTCETFFDILSLSADERKVYQEMGKYKKVDKSERNKKIMQLACQRFTNNEIAVQCGCSEDTVQRVLKNFNKTDFLAVQVKELRKNMTIKQVAEALNISSDTVKRLQKR